MYNIKINGALFETKPKASLDIQCQQYYTICRSAKNIKILTFQ